MLFSCLAEYIFGMIFLMHRYITQKLKDSTSKCSIREAKLAAGVVGGRDGEKAIDAARRAGTAKT